MTSVISLWKKSFHLRFLLRLPSIDSSEEVEEEVELDKRSVGMVVVDEEGNSKVVGFVGCGGGDE